jgi:hypothetical protein
MEYSWNIHGISMEYPWNINGILMGECPPGAIKRGLLILNLSMISPAVNIHLVRGFSSVPRLITRWYSQK